MQIQNLKTHIDKIDKIYHVADIHIRNLKRHEEYITVFNRTIDAIKKTIGPNDIIFLGGDIVHAKTDMTPELVEAVQQFLKMFSDLAPTILITGNHDCNLNNKSRLDALTPIVNALNHPNLFYLKESGVYKMADKHFTVMSVFDKPKDFIKASEFEGDYKIALHHGAVNNALTDIGFRLVNDHVDIETFKGYNITLLGDIHKPNQFLDDARTIAYPGSLIQQNYAEALIHGMLVWDTNTSQAEFIEIDNDICFFTLEVDNSNYSPVPIELQDKQIRLRIKSQNTEPADLKSIIAQIKSKFNIVEYTVQKINDFTQNKTRVQKINIGDVRDVEYQNTLITKYLENKFSLENEILDGVRHVNRTVNSGLPNLEVNRNVSWIPKRFEFSNMFSYGKGNSIDFTSMKGVYGLFAPNAAGKSTLLDAITYCIFDKCGRTSKAVSVLNNRSASFACKFNFELDGKNYFIEKVGTKGRGNHVRVDVNFYTVDDLGQEISLNGKERSETNDHIRALLGTYEDFVLTALSVQNNNSGFIDMAQKDRKDLLAQFLDINIFEDLYRIANNDIKEVATLVKEYQRQDFGSQLAQAVNDIDTYTIEHRDYQLDKTELETKINDLNQEILSLTSKLVPVDTSIVNKDRLDELKTQATSFLTQLENDAMKKQKELSECKESLSELQESIKLFNISKIQARIDVLDSLHTTEKNLYGQVEKLKAEVGHKLDKMKKLDDLKYDENCSFCMDNIFVKDAIATKASIEQDKKDAQILVDDLQVIKDKIIQLKPSIQEKEDYNKLNQDIHKTQSLKSSIESELHQIESKYHQGTARLGEVDTKIAEYYKQEAVINENVNINSQISGLNVNVSTLKNELDTLNDAILTCHSNLLVSEKLKEKAEESIEKLKDLTQQYKYYQYYLEAVNRDGVPYDLITSAVPYIEQEINNILSQLVEFSLMLEMDGKNINCYIVYDEDNFWPIELTSGMEKFVSSLAIRTALINVSSLPRPNFLAIDEGFGVLDSENLNSMFNLFDYLKTQFSFMLVISHIDSMRDVVDKLIEITKTNGSSKISYN
jgi:DNA repair exonuclease SbcCD ATPase subunit/DNA repair exonuclease SbcCD nuclease subunit